MWKVLDKVWGSNGFNLNLLECKSVCCNDNGISADCFNLNLLECKCRRTAAECVPTVRFNLNLLECKLTWLFLHVQSPPVLISTYWNVNHRWIQWYCRVWNVLISTYWNVNDFPPDAWFICAGFNLNLLECKSILEVSISISWYCFNLNLLECKLTSSSCDVSCCSF